jgi:guanylate kinase
MTEPARQGLLLVISGPSAVGKDTIVKRLLELDPLIRYSVSYTTRPKRDYEVNAVHYSFVDEREFAVLARAGEFLENAVYNGFRYGTSASRVEEARAGGLDILLKIDVQGAEQVRRRCPEGVFIFIAPPSMDELIRRRLGRGTESPEALEGRQRAAELEMGFADRYDHIVVNNEVEQAAQEIAEIVLRARERLC